MADLSDDDHGSARRKARVARVEAERERAVREARNRARINRVNEVSAMARASWITLLAYLAFVGVTLLGVEDADFFVPSRQTQLPLVNVSIPTESFFFFAPILAAALYVYLHIVLLKLWDAIADIDASEIDGQPLGEFFNPWLVNDWALTKRGGAFTPPRPLLSLGNWASFLLVWAAGPAALVGFWWRSMPAHDEGLTLLLGVCLTVALHVGFVSWRTAEAAFARPRRGHTGAWWLYALGFLLTFAPIAAISWLRTEGGFDHWANRAIDLYELTAEPVFIAGTYANGDPKDPQTVQEEWVAAWIPKLDLFTVTSNKPVVGRWIDPDEPWSPLARTDLARVEMVDVPAEWRTPETARHAFRQVWCGREGLAMTVCDHPESADRPVAAAVWDDRGAWCEEQAIDPAADCRTHFEGLEQRFEVAWTEERDAALASLPQLNLADRDLRQVFALRATLIRANLGGARLERADLRWARLEGANLGGARLDGADLREARLEEAYLREARLDGADLRETRLEGADLREARLEGANLGGARLERANLGGARLEGADLREARLEGANLGGARLEEADLRGARLERAVIRGARLERANLDGAHLVGADLAGARLERANLREARLDGANLAQATLQRADLAGARLEKANLVGAGLEGADLRKAFLELAYLDRAHLVGAYLREARMSDARLSGADLEGTFLGSADLRGAAWARTYLRSAAHFADFRGAQGLSQAQLDNVIGNAGTLLPDDPPMYVYTCWTDPPEDLDALIERTALLEFRTVEEIYNEWVCGSDNPRRKVGTPLALDAPYPVGHPLADRD